MARRYRRRYGAGRDLFPTQVAAVALVFMALLGALVVWGLMPDAGDAAAEALAREEADRASFGEPARSPAPAPSSPAVTAPAPPPSSPPPPAAPRVAEVESAGPAASPPGNDATEPAPPERAPSRSTRVAQAAPQPRQSAPTTSDAAYSSTRAGTRSARQTPTAPRGGGTRPVPPRASPSESSIEARMTVVTAADANAAGERALAAGRPREAAGHFQRATALDPDDAAYRTSYASALLRAGDAPTAVRQLEQVLRDNYRLAGVWALLGEARLDRGDTAGARFAYGRYIELERDPRLRSDAQNRMDRLRSN